MNKVVVVVAIFPFRWTTISSDERTETGGIAGLRLQDAETKPSS